ncbi:MAG: 1-acyl-sn-glycerol-3-phosphate acyltransferase [Candidatus Marinimicrobia bacterium]|nr:1-acyl-sn-glycerol-3-phosphate acyltransferase [Candidatus Neomarinimicrobiota bacterium]
MKWVRTGWVLINIVAATFTMGTLTLVISIWDRRKRIQGWWNMAWSRWILWSTGLPITVRGRENLVRGQQYIYIGNHSSALDIPLVLAALPGSVTFLAKIELFSIPYFGWIMRAMGCIPVNRSNLTEARKSVDRALEALRAKAISIILYPEGTRTLDGHLLPFKKGGFRLALRSGLPVVPVAVQGAFQATPPGALSLTPTPIRVTIGLPIKTDHFTEKECDVLLKQTREQIQTLLDA